MEEKEWGQLDDIGRSGCLWLVVLQPVVELNDHPKVSPSLILRLPPSVARAMKQCCDALSQPDLVKTSPPAD